MAYVGQKPADKALTSSDIEDGTILNADINSSAAIATSKLASNAIILMVLPLHWWMYSWCNYCSYYRY